MHAVSGPYELVDAGDGRRLERFGSVLVDRPAQPAVGSVLDPGSWKEAGARYIEDRAAGHGHWAIADSLPDPWELELAGMTFELRPTDAGQVGVFPEHAVHWSWLRDRATERLAGGGVEVLHLFAYTGGATLAVAGTGAAVVHVDASRPSVAWARRNADRSGLADRPVRWIVDDAAAFAAREVRRGRRYAGLVLDPPTYGHGPAGQAWRLSEDLDELLAAGAALLASDAFILLTAHTPGETPERLAHRLVVAVRHARPSIECGELVLDARSGTRLLLGAWARCGGPR